MIITAELREAFEDVDGKVGPLYRTELVDGEIIVVPAPHGTHEFVIGELIEQFRKSVLPIRMSMNRGLGTPTGNYVPDITIAEPGYFEGRPPWGTPEGVLMVVEITSNGARRDREDKRRAYAAASIPLYLLVDRDEKQTSLFSAPDVEVQDYADLVRVHFGASLELPAPFSFTLTDFTPTDDH